MLTIIFIMLALVVGFFAGFNHHVYLVRKRILKALDSLDDKEYADNLKECLFEEAQK